MDNYDELVKYMKSIDERLIITNALLERIAAVGSMLNNIKIITQNSIPDNTGKTFVRRRGLGC